MASPPRRQAPAGCSFPPDERIRRRADFQRAYEQGARLHGRFMTLIILPNSRRASRLGVAATRKLGGAVRRNRAKRLVREIFRRHKTSTGLDIVVVPRREILDASFATLEADFCTTLDRRGRLQRFRPAGRTS